MTKNTAVVNVKLYHFIVHIIHFFHLSHYQCVRVATRRFQVVRERSSGFIVRRILYGNLSAERKQKTIDRWWRHNGFFFSKCRIFVIFHGYTCFDAKEKKILRCHFSWSSGWASSKPQSHRVTLHLHPATHSLGIVVYFFLDNSSLQVECRIFLLYF